MQKIAEIISNNILHYSDLFSGTILYLSKDSDDNSSLPFKLLLVHSQSLLKYSLSLAIDHTAHIIYMLEFLNLG